MTYQLIVSLGRGNLREGFPAVTARIVTPHNRNPLQVTGSLPGFPQLSYIYQRWLLLYQGLYQGWEFNPRIEFDPADITNVSEVEFSQLCNRFGETLNEWLDTPGFRPIERQIRSLLHPTDTIQAILETDNTKVRRLPWQLWNFLTDYPNTELSLSLPNYRHGVKTKIQRNRVRILAILGKSQGIDLDRDRAELQSLPHTEIQLLVEPSRREIDRHLWDERGWDILFFAGHSGIQTDENRGELWVNATETLAIAQLKPALQTAIARGLQLAIFNSCDGLALATNLAELHIPQTIVMREPVPDAIAQAFLTYFLPTFANGKPLDLAVREAREKLYSLEDRFPCASWLPVICHNPAEAMVLWHQLPGNPARVTPDPPPTQRIAWTSIVIGFVLWCIRQLGGLQPLELYAYDLLMRSRPSEPPDHRLLLVMAVESDKELVESYPLNDRDLNQLLKAIDRNRPRVIGINLYRDHSVPPGSDPLNDRLQNQSNLIGICKTEDNNQRGIKPHSSFPNSRIGFNDIVVDPDRVVRRHLVFMKSNAKCPTKYAFSTHLAFRYLQAEGLFPRSTPQGFVKIGDKVLTKLQPNTGGYRQIDSRGSQLLLNYRMSEPIARSVTLTDVLAGNIDPSWIRDKIVLIGSKMESTPGDLLVTPYARDVPGTLIHAHMTSQIISAVLDDRPSIDSLSFWQEWVWIAAWILVAEGLTRMQGNRFRLFASTGIAVAILYGICWVALIRGLWLPLVPSGLGTILLPIFLTLRDRLGLRSN